MRVLGQWLGALGAISVDSVALIAVVVVCCLQGGREEMSDSSLITGDGGGDVDTAKKRSCCRLLCQEAGRERALCFVRQTTTYYPSSVKVSFIYEG